jgi:4-hydroxybenzoate polyprenyltransferase
LILSIILNTIGLFIAYFASYRIALFFLIYQFLFWLFSHKINKILLLNNLTYALLVSFPFLALFLLYNNFSSIILLHSGFLFILIWVADILKDYRSLHADIIYNYETIPSRFSEFRSKSILSFLLIIALSISIFFVFMFQTNYLILYHYVSQCLILLLLFGLWKNKNPTTFYGLSSLMFRFYVLVGVLSIPLLKYSKLILHNFLDHLVK